MTILLKYLMPSKNVYDFIITVYDTDPNTYEFKSLKLHPWEFGQDDDIDSILYPGSVKIEFGLFGAGIQRKPGYFTIINKLSFVQTSVVVKKNGVNWFYGYVDSSSIDGEYDHSKINMKIISNFAKLKNIDPHYLNPSIISDSNPTPTGIPCAFFSKTLLETIKLVWPITQVIIPNDLKVTTNWTFLGQPYDSPADNWGDYAYRMWGSNPANPYNDCISLIKAILSSLGCVGILIGDKFILQSRFYFSNETITLTNLIKDNLPKPYRSQKIDGLQILVRPFDSLVEYEAIWGKVEKDDLGNLLNPDRVETIFMHICAGDPPGIDGNIYPMLVRKMFVYIPEFIAGIGNGQWDLAKRNEVYSTVHPTKGPLWKVIGDSIWSDVSQDRTCFRTEVLTHNFDYDKFYKFPEHPQKFRARKIFYDDERFVTELDLIRITAESQEFIPEETTVYGLFSYDGFRLSTSEGYNLFTITEESS